MVDLPEPGTEVVETIYGPVRGVFRQEMSQFLGIPYAAPPVGDLRWRPPASPTPWAEPLDVRTFGSVCAQDTTGLPGFGHFSDTEDCLYLNVFTPAQSEPGRQLPVMVWIPGGGLYCGGSTGYDPSALVLDGDIVFVSINYRLNVFGFFSHPAINAEGHASGNYGILDQQCALRWVQHNIAKFGGDPENVTIFGESAGGISVLANMASPASAGLFHRAILQSCSGAAITSAQSLQSQEHVGVALAAAAGCDEQTTANLRALSTHDLMAADAMAQQMLGVGKFHIGLVVDGEIIPEPMRELFSTGRFNHVPLINGINRDEFAWFQAMIEFHTGHVISDEEYPSAVETTLAALASSPVLGVEIPPEAIPDILIRYPLEKYPSASRALAAIIGDCGFISMGGRRTTRVIREFVSDVYAYEWDVPDSPVSWPEVSFPYGSAHSQEIQYIFPSFHGGCGVPHDLNSSQKELAKKMVSYWTTFAHRGNPNAELRKNPEWPAYASSVDNFMSLSLPGPTIVNSFGESHHCDFWDELTQVKVKFLG
ncbi:carboxylesterase/lipase family protein [Rhodococcus sp. JVH1]|uniref:carboxylesterase/lipase family protein n=1 Tax=Rhodococcus sp. JVH1 TaxID=745408 RepID=UPI0002720E17|nr:carboxylesterase family protein [Rhodococcus sp. JVH1]EJI95851.1 carboxylesterase family protein [Rhodococcus sp. JVH1]